MRQQTNRESETSLKTEKGTRRSRDETTAARVGMPRRVLVSQEGDPFDVVLKRARKRHLTYAALIGVPTLVVLGGAALMALRSGPDALSNDAMPFVVPGVIGLVFTVKQLFSSSMRKSEYYSIQGSRFEQGDHRCIHCGGRGIWRRSPYKTQHVVAACSKCKTELFRELKI